VSVGQNLTRPLHRLLESDRLKRLQQVIERIYFKRAKGMLVERGRENHHWQQRMWNSSQHLESIHVRHLHVKKDQVRPARLDVAERLESIPAFTNDFHVRLFAKEHANMQPGQLLVIYNKRSYFHEAFNSDSRNLHGLGVKREMDLGSATLWFGSPKRKALIISIKRV
jgi:hypothetical protein